MASLLRSSVVSGILGLAALTAAGGCVQDQDFLTVQSATWFDARENCTLSNSGTNTPLAMMVDTAYESQIGMGFVVANNQSPNANSNTGLDDSEIQINSAEVVLSFSGGAVEGGTFEVTLPSNSIAGGDTGVFMVALPSSVTASLRDTMSGLPAGTIETLEMEVIFKGQKYGQSGNSKLGQLDSRPYVYPFNICFNCLTDCNQCEEGGCPTATEWVGTCGFAQGLSVYHPVCDLETTP